MIERSSDEQLGYLEGQRTAQSNIYLKGQQLTNVAGLRMHEAAHLLDLSRRSYLKGFRRGYFDELNGLAHPLPEEER